MHVYNGDAFYLKDNTLTRGLLKDALYFQYGLNNGSTNMRLRKRNNVLLKWQEWWVRRKSRVWMRCTVWCLSTPGAMSYLWRSRALAKQMSKMNLVPLDDRRRNEMHYLPSNTHWMRCQHPIQVGTSEIQHRVAANFAHHRKKHFLIVSAVLQHLIHAYVPSLR